MSLKFVTARFANHGDLDEISQLGRYPGENAASPKFWGAKCFTLGETQYFAWDTTSQSAIWL